jgi:hypothetical protein
MDLLRQIEKQINKQSQITNENNSNKPLLNDAVVLSHSDQSLIRNLYFELYLINKITNITMKSPLSGGATRKIVKTFRTISAYKLLLNDNLSKLKRFKRNNNNNNEQELITFEYNLTNLWPNTKYSFELSARMFNLESYSSRVIKITTMRKCLTLFS